MAEAFELGASILDLLEIAGSVIIACYKYQDGVRNGSKGSRKIREQLMGLRSAIEALQELEVESKNSGLDLSLLKKPLSMCFVELGALQTKLELKTGWKGKMDALMWPLNDSETNKTLTRLEELKSTIQMTLTTEHTKLSINIGKNVDHVQDTLKSEFADLKEAAEIARLDILLKNIHVWLAAPDPSSNYHDARKKQQPGTCIWFLEGDSFKIWKFKGGSLLWLDGIPGSGKTVLCAFIVDDIASYCRSLSNAAVAFFHFDFSDEHKRSPGGLLRSLITQFSAALPNIPQALNRLYSQHRQPSINELKDVLKEVLGAFEHAYIIIDALDESTERSELMTLLGEISGWNLDNVHILATSRKEKDIEECLEKTWHSVDISNTPVNVDIHIHVTKVLQLDGRLLKLPDDIKKEIEDTLVKGANGMFRWVACQLDVLRKCLSMSKLRNALKSLPKTLDETYERILANIDEEDRPSALRILQWLAFSARPVSVNEVVEAIAVNLEDEPHFDPGERLLDPQDLLLLCPSLVTISGSVVSFPKFERWSIKETGDSNENPGDRVLSLAHFTVKEYLISDRIRNSKVSFYSLDTQMSNASISHICLVYLMQFKKLHSNTRVIYKRFPLTRYAAEFWLHHAKSTKDIAHSVLEESIMQFLQPHHAHYYNWSQFSNSYQFSGLIRRHMAPIMLSPLYHVSLVGIECICARLLENGVEVNNRKEESIHALHVAAENGHGRVVHLLLDHGADINAKGGSLGNALQVAAYYGQEEIVQLLLNRGADVHAEGGQHNTALQAAAYNGHKDIVKLLLDCGADARGQDGTYGRPLAAAANRGHGEVTKLFLDCGVDVNAPDGRYGNALRAAASEGHMDVMKLLLDHGADVNAQGGGVGTALYVAAWRGDEDTVELLLDHGASVNAQGGFYGNALRAAASGGQKGLVQLLLDRGADVNAHDGEHGTALQAAAWRGREGIVQLLLDNGADVNAKGGAEGDALQAAERKGEESIVQLLLKNGARTHIQGSEHGDALQEVLSSTIEPLWQSYIPLYH